MRWPTVILLLSAAWASGQEEETPKPPPAFLPLRFNEDYSRLADPSVRTDPFDPLEVSSASGG